MSRTAAMVAGLVLAGLSPVLSASWMVSADHRLEAWKEDKGDQPAVAVAQADERGYCTTDLKKVLRRVLTSCGLVGADGSAARGCQPLEAKSIATLSDGDFNALFLPLADRAAIIMYDKDSAELDPADNALIDEIFADRAGASYFFVVARSSPEGSVAHNRELSQARGEAVVDHLRQTFPDADFDREVGLLWLGEEYAQLETSFCSWRNSGESCDATDLNRSAFLAWIDCRL